MSNDVYRSVGIALISAVVLGIAITLLSFIAQEGEGLWNRLMH